MISYRKSDILKKVKEQNTIRLVYHFEKESEDKETLFYKLKYMSKELESLQYPEILLCNPDANLREMSMAMVVNMAKEGNYNIYDSIWSESANVITFYLRKI